MNALLEPVATLVPGRPGSLNPSQVRERPLVVVREDGALQIHAPEAGPANCCDRRMLHTFINRNGTTLCPTSLVSFPTGLPARLLAERQ